VNVSPVDGGVVEIDDETPPSLPVTRSVPSGATVRLEAVPAFGYRFDGWDGAVSGSDNPATVTMTCTKKVTASFSPIMHTLSTAVDGQGSVTTETGDGSYAMGTSVMITATPESGWQFDGWSGDVDDPTSATTSVSIDSAREVTAIFSRITHRLALTTTGSGTVTPSASEGELVEGSVVSITAVPEPGWRFERWTGGVSDPDSVSTTVTIASDTIISAVFVRIEHSLTIRIEGSGSTVPGEGSHSYAEGTVVDVGAVPEEGWQFDGWSGDIGEPELAETALTMDSDRTTTASFSRAAPIGWLAGGITAGVAIAIAAVWWLARGRSG